VTWQVVAVANLLIAIAYMTIAWIIASGLVRSGQLRSNRLGGATALIFLTCGIHHGAHTLHMLLPYVGLEQDHGLAMRAAWDWHAAIWDILSAGVAFYYLSLRGSYASVLRGAQLFEDLKVRERQALEINDSIVQGLAVAKYAMDQGSDERSRQAVEETLRGARTLISDLLGDEDAQLGVAPGELRRQSAAGLAGAVPTGRS
jgi:hypothetical protein